MDIYKEKFKFIRDSYTGLGGFKPNHEYSYVIPFTRESNEDHQDRKNITVLTNYFTPLINIYLSPIFGADIELVTENNTLIDVWENSDLIKIANKTLLNLKLYELAFYGYLIDSNGILDVFSIETPEVLEIKSVMNKLTYLVYTEYKEYEDLNIPILCEYKTSDEDNYVKKTTLAWYDEENNIVLTETDRRVTIFDEVIYNVEIFRIGQLELDETPTTFQSALTNYDIFNLESLQKEILYRNAISILVIATDQNIGEISLGAGNILKVPSDVSKMPEYLEISSVNHDILDTTIENKKQYLYKMFTNNLLADNIQYTTAMSSLIASRSFDSEVNYLYQNYKIILSKLVNNILERFDIVTAYTIDFPEINYNVESIQQEMNSIYRD